MSYTNSIILGKSENGKLHKAEGYQHILLLAPNGSGKGVSFVLPTLLNLDESCIVHDIVISVVLA
jgi:type IV secretory pathway TraG/TraD family ATPase VirD4